MSGAVYDFTCTRCDFEGSYASASGAFVYRTAAGLNVDVPWSTAWCTGCGTMRRIQKGLSGAALDAECRRLAQMMPPARKRSLLAWLFRRQNSDSAALRRRERLREKRQLLALLGGRDSRDACLSCGNTEVQLMGWGRADETPRPLEYSHPGCGGQLLVSTQMRIAWQPQTAGCGRARFG